MHCNNYLQPVTRREMLQQSCCGVGVVALATLINDITTRAEAQGTARLPEAKAKRLIFLFMAGGVSHMDTFDPKPMLTKMNGQPLPFAKPKVQFGTTGNLLKSPWEFKHCGQSGVEVSDLFPHVASCIDDIAVIRSMHCDNSAHGGALLQLHTGADAQIRPSMGAWLVYGLGSENENLPGYVTLVPIRTHGGAVNYGSAFLPAHTQGMTIGYDGMKIADAQIRNIKNAETTLAQQRRQLDFLKDLNTDHLARNGNDPRLEGRIKNFEMAFRMQTAAPDLLEIRGESKATLDLYGVGNAVTDDFGRQCLLARRFAERGVRVVQVTHCSGAAHWDQHGDLRNGHTKNAAEVDQPIAALLKDLKSRGLLDETLVLWATEFGRTPTAQGTDGRDHNPHGFCCWLAGGGIKGGMTYGETDDFGYYAAVDKCHLHDLHATILHLMGLDHEKLTYRHAGRDFRLTDVSGEVVKPILA